MPPMLLTFYFHVYASRLVYCSFKSILLMYVHPDFEYSLISVYGLLCLLEYSLTCTFYVNVIRYGYIILASAQSISILSQSDAAECGFRSFVTVSAT